MRVLLLFFLLLLIFSTQGQNESTVIQWNNLLLNTIKITKSAPPVISRMLFMINSAIYDAWSAYDQLAVATTFAGNLRRPVSEATIENKNKALSYAAFVVFNDLLPAYVNDSTNLMIKLGYDPTITTKDFVTPQGIGIIAGSCMKKGRVGDGSNQIGDLSQGSPYSDYTNYVPINKPDQLINPDLWQPLNISNGNGGFNIQKFAVPHWGTVKTFANDDWPPISAPPYKYPSPEYLAQNEEILSIYANLDDNKKMIAEYWAGGPGTVTPPGIWINYAQYISNRDSYDLDKDVKLFFMLSAALFDSSVVCWGMKRYYNSVRPISAIRFLYQGKVIKSWGGPGMGIQEMNGENWIPYQELNFVTPPFPDFYSGHSTFSGAAAQILKSFTGSDRFEYKITIPAGSSIIEPGKTPSQDLNFFYNTFTEAAQEAGISRLYGGIHYRSANLNGLSSGAIIGQNVFLKATNLINGQQISLRSIPVNKSSASSLSFFSVFVLLIFALILFLF